MISPLYNHLAEQSGVDNGGAIHFLELPPGAGRAYLEDHSMTPLAIAKVLSRDLPGNIELSVKYNRTMGEEKLQTSIWSRGVDDEGIFEASKSFHISKNGALSGQINVADSCQGQKIGRTIMRNQIELAALLGFKDFQISCIESGAYSWAKMGFYLKESERHDLQDMIDHRVGSIVDVLPGSLLERIEKLRNFKHSHDLSELANLDYDLSATAQQVSKILDKNKDEVGVDEYGWAENFWNFLGAHFEAASARNKPLTLGRALLVDTTWNGKLDLQDSCQMQRIADYAGGFEYLEIKP